MTSKTASILDEDVLRVVRSHLPGMRNPERVEVDTDLWDAGMDSLANIAVMVAVEDTYGVEFTDELLTREVFRTVGNIADAVRSLQTAA
jgi:acyl carrier protein